jgi:uncharacterized protein
LVKLVLLEPETHELQRYLAGRNPQLITSRIAVVEVSRAALMSVPTEQTREDVARLLRSCAFVDVTEELLVSASRFASAQLRTLDAIHFATALDVGPDEVIAYDRRLVEAADAAHLRVVSPGR